MLDANARTGPPDHVHILQHGDEISPNTEHLINFLRGRGLCLPATGLRHAGEHTTWTSPDGCHDQRIDYIAIPQTLQHAVVSSCVLTDFDLGNVTADHKAVGLQLQWQLRVPGSTRLSPTSSSRSFDRDRIAASTFDSEFAA